MCIRDRFEIVSEEEAASLESQGYTKVNWGIDLVDNRDEYDKYPVSYTHLDVYKRQKERS